MVEMVVILLQLNHQDLIAILLGSLDNQICGIKNHRLYHALIKKKSTLSYFSFRLDGISFHWRCPSKTFAPIQDSVKENLLIEETVYKNSASIQISLQGNQIIYWIAIILLVLSHN